MSNPALSAGKWIVPKDPDDKSFFWGNITQDLNDRGTTATSILEVVAGVTVDTPTAIVIVGDQTWLKVKLSGMDVSSPTALNFCTFRVTCANTEQFDRTMWFIREDH